MAGSIEAFVAKLQEEGVQAGQQAADRLLVDARKQADATLAQAEADAKKIVSGAQAEAASTLEKSKVDLQLAARDTALRLRDALSRAVRAILAAGVKPHLTNADFLGKLLYDIVMQYARANIEEKTTVRINVAPEMQHQLTQWALQHLRDKPDMGNVSLDLKGTLADAGFEYQVDGANVEVTLSSIVEALTDLVNPNLREMLEQAMAEPKR